VEFLEEGIRKWEVGMRKAEGGKREGGSGKSEVGIRKSEKRKVGKWEDQKLRRWEDIDCGFRISDFWLIRLQILDFGLLIGEKKDGEKVERWEW